MRTVVVSLCEQQLQHAMRLGMRRRTIGRREKLKNKKMNRVKWMNLNNLDFQRRALENTENSLEPRLRSRRAVIAGEGGCAGQQQWRAWQWLAGCESEMGGEQRPRKRKPVQSVAAAPWSAAPGIGTSIIMGGLSFLGSYRRLQLLALMNCVVPFVVWPYPSWM